MTYSESRARYAETLDSVVDDREEVIITRVGGREPVIMLALSEYESLMETFHLMRSPANARRITDAIRELEHGGGEVHDLIDPDDVHDDSDEWCYVIDVTDDLVAFRAELRRRREEAGLTYSEAASKAGIHISGQRWRDIETGSSNPSRDNLIEMAKAVELPVADALRLAGQNPGAHR